MRALSLLALALVFLLPAQEVSAQLSSATAGISVSVSPQHPRPYDTVTVTISSTLVNLNASDISISADGVVVSEGSKSAKILMKGPGSRTSITATVTDATKTHTKTVVLRPVDVSLVLEPNTTAHPFYEGSRLVAPESSVRIIALADMRTASGAKIPDADLSYTWKVGNKVLTSDSGIGKSVLNATAPVRYRDAQVSVTVSTKDGTQTGNASVVVSPTTPIVRVYKHDSLGGTDFTKALFGTFTLASSEETFEVVPYFFGDVPSYEWLLNGNMSGTDRLVTVRTTGTQSGTAQLTASAKIAKTGEQAQSRFTVQFGNGSTNIFGF